MKRDEFEKAIIAPKDKVIVRIEKGDNRLSFEVNEVRAGTLIKAGSDCSQSTQDAVGGMANFGQYNAELPFQIEDCGYLVMAEDNLHVIVKE